jgi:hypothetical protein
MNTPQQSRKVQDWLRSLPTDGSTAARPIVERDGPRHKIERGSPTSAGTGSWPPAVLDDRPPCGSVESGWDDAA